MILAIATYCMLSLVIIGYDELFSLWAATEPHLGKLGGAEMELYNLVSI